MSDKKLPFIKLSEDAVKPKRADDRSVGYDLYSVEEWYIRPGERQLVKTNIAISLPDGIEAQIRSRSGLALKHGIIVLNSPGTIDPGYDDGVGVILINTSNDTYHVTKGERIAQMVFAKFEIMELVEQSMLTDGTRGGGFGHSGKQ